MADTIELTPQDEAVIGFFNMLSEESLKKGIKAEITRGAYERYKGHLNTDGLTIIPDPKED